MINANQIIIEVFRNYISNVIKYAKAGKKMIIDVFKKDDIIVINVKDFGKSIQKEDYRNLFTRKYQIEKGRGRGLGLAIVKRIAEAHNAEVGVKPNKPTGNIFYIEIPI
ncbi:MAG: ATP-binding protein [Candidatus Marinimicrobia bacterium]|nr:ATP-binding protein [Candidatus Neomarinimicrobiota bacterium]